MESMTFKLKGDKMESEIALIKSLRALKREYNVTEFIDVPQITDPEPFD